MEAVKNFLKKYAALLPPAALLLACVVVFVLVMLLNGNLRAEIDERIKAASEVRSLVSQTPSKNQPGQEQAYQAQHSTDAQTIETLVVLTSQRELICPASDLNAPVIFPQPKEKTSQVYLEFGKKYRQAIEDFMPVIAATDAPNEQEIRNQIGASALRPGEYNYAAPGGQNPSQNAMVDALCLARAEKIAVYANPGLFTWYPFWENYQFKSADQALQDAWYSQVAYWIYEDIIATIGRMNAGSAKVAKSDVKRLLGVSFSGPVQVQASSSPYAAGYYDTPSMAAASYADRPAYVLNNTFAAASWAEPWTGRVCDDRIDVVHFAVSVVLDSRAVLKFMHELCSTKQHTYRENFVANGPQKTAQHNQITILQNDIEPVLRETDPVHTYYRYGNASVVRLNLVCEYLFYRQGYDAVKPDIIKEQLSPTQSDSTGAGQPAAPVPQSTPVKDPFGLM